MDSQQVSDLIGVIYDCVLEPRLWQPAIERMCALTHSATGALGVNALPSGEGVLSTTVGIAPEWVARLSGYGEQVMQIWGGVERVRQYPLDEPVVCSRATDRSTWCDNTFYTEWAVPQGLVESVSIAIARDRTMIGSITFGRGEEHRDVSEGDLSVLRLLAPHVRRAVTISRLFDREALAAATFAAALDTLTVGVIIVASDLTVVHTNGRARELLTARAAAWVEWGRVQLRSDAATSALRLAVAAAAGDEASLGSRGICIPVNGGEPAVVHVLPLVRRPHRGELAAAAVAAIFIAPASSAPRLPSDALALIYDLTPAESRVCEMVIEGRTPAEISTSLGIAPSTVKTHLLRVFAKTGRHRQAELVQLAASLSTGL